ncbi:glycoside hydrolase family 15 protein [Pelagibacterium limicola]|uniref:glycoside hydrolase family 15 protein n=1 Tax=Pelagibacterium limicola TaxID=2791022 RepID=UPI0018AFB2BE|nr:glycoside hydrolase family 15 protein [Pelagibacterium limicola]
MGLKISDYAMIGDCESAALVGNNGSIDWLCWPRFDSEACFVAILGSEEHGHWQIAPATAPARVERSYSGDNPVLQTDFHTESGSVRLIDFMPVRKNHEVSDLVRIVVGLEGEVLMNMDLRVRFDYGRIAPWATRSEDQRALRATAGPHSVTLSSPVDLEEDDRSIVSTFTVRKGQRLPFVMAYEASHLPPPKLPDAEKALKETEAFWREWSKTCSYKGPWREAVMRSIITVKAMTYRPTGGVVAAITTSLPEAVGGERNWDYRYCWLRDAYFTVLSLANAGYRKEAEQWCDWLLRAVAGAPSQLQPLYSIAGERRTGEVELEGLPGHRGSHPVRAGNAAYAQLQIDVYGSVIDTLYEARCLGLDLHETSRGVEHELLRHLETIWDKPDAGIWEVRSDPQHFVHGKLMAWVAFDRAIASAERFGFEGPVDHWRGLRADIRRDIEEKGFSRKRNAFVQAYGAEALDASVLLMPIVGFLDVEDPRMASTIAAIEENLMREGLVLRYDTEESVDGLPGDEGAFLACSFWLADNYILQGRRNEAITLFERILSLRNDVGLLSEQYDWEGKELVGNFPQAFSHFALVDTAYNLAQDEKKGQGKDRK